ncbi:nitroreductase family protein [Thermococcus chitonophagus]|nr:nitroreductase family protein [Thermococcus chitonophagus]
MTIIKGRRAVRKFDDKQIPLHDLKEILEAGIWAPSASNIQPWEFILVTEKQKIEKIKLVSPGLFGNPAALVILCINKERAKKGGRLGEKYALMDIAMAAQNMMLVAYSKGIGSCPVVSFNRVAVKEILSIPEHVDPVLILTLGYPKFWPKPPKRRKEVMHLEEYGNVIE